jgi:hypothetical protein
MSILLLVVLLMLVLLLLLLMLLLLLLVLLSGANIVVVHAVASIAANETATATSVLRVHIVFGVGVIRVGL